jgi:TRAP-type C4-dicarboxylate transport system permease small subunit
LHTLKTIDRILKKIEGYFLIVLLTIMILVSFSQVILRNFFHEGILWADIFLRQLVLWVGFLGASLAVCKDKHIGIDFLPNVLPRRWKPKLRFITHLASSIISAILAWSAWNFLQYEMESDSVLFLNIPVWVFQTILPYSFAVISVRFLLQALDTHTASPDNTIS